MESNQEIIDQPIIENAEKPISLINDSSIFNKGLFGLILCILPGAIIGLILVKISLDQAKVATKQYKSNPGKYKPESYQKVKSGKIMAYIGLGLFILEIIALVSIIR